MTDKIYITNPIALAWLAGNKDGKEYKLSEPREPSFEDDFDCDIDPPDQYEYEYPEITIEDIAIEKGHEYARKECDGSPAHAIKNITLYGELKAAYQAGFLEGFAHRFTQPSTESEET